MVQSTLMRNGRPFAVVTSNKPWHSLSPYKTETLLRMLNRKINNKK